MSPLANAASLSAAHVPLSQRLDLLLATQADGEGMTLNQIIQRTEGRGIYLVMIFACLPFVVPVSLPGLSLLMGLIIGALSLRLALGQTPRLPRFLGEHRFKPVNVQRIFKASVRLLRFLEKVVRPRRTRWLAWPSAMLFNGLLMVFLAFLMALPFPPIVLFTNSLPSYAIILLALSIMEEDGVMIWLGYLVSLATVAYFGLMGGVLLPYVLRWVDRLFDLMRSAT